MNDVVSKPSEDGRIESMLTFVALVSAERTHQREKWGDNPHVRSWVEWASILGEEYGEVCQALNGVHWERESPYAAGRHGLRGELVQLATVCAAIIERLDGN